MTIIDVILTGGALRRTIRDLVEAIDKAPHGHLCPADRCGLNFKSGRPCRRSPGCHGDHLAHEFEPLGECNCWKADAFRLVDSDAIALVRAHDRDAARLDWLEQNPRSESFPYYDETEGGWGYPYAISSANGLGGGVGFHRLNSLRAAIDAAIAAEGEK